MPTAPERLTWAVDVLAPAPDAAVLEIGGGPGVSTALICERLATGHVLAVDRSAVAIERTVRRNAVHLEAGRLAVLVSSLAELDVPGGAFDAALAVDVNLFWTTPATAELDVLARALRPGGTLHVLYGVGGPTSGERILPAVSERLRAHGWTDVTIRDEPAGMGVSAVRGPDRAGGAAP